MHYNSARIHNRVRVSPARPPGGPMAFAERSNRADSCGGDACKALYKGCVVKDKFNMWFALVFAILLGIQSLRCVLLGLDEPRAAWKSVCFAGAAICAFVAYVLWRRFASIRKSLNSDD